MICRPDPTKYRLYLLIGGVDIFLGNAATKKEADGRVLSYELENPWLPDCAVYWTEPPEVCGCCGEPVEYCECPVF